MDRFSCHSFPVMLRFLVSTHSEFLLKEILVINNDRDDRIETAAFSRMDHLDRPHGGLCRFMRGYYLCLWFVSPGDERNLSLEPFCLVRSLCPFLRDRRPLGPVAGITIAKFGPRKNIIGFNLIAALGLLGLSQTNALWQVYLFFGAMAGLGIAFGEFIPITTVINHWFIRRRSMAMGLFLASGGVGGFVSPPLISTLISDLGWRWAWGYLAGRRLFLTVILGGILIRNRPEDMGQYPDGIPETPGHPALDQTVQRHPVYQTAVDWSAGEAMRTPALWMIMALFSIILFVTNMLTTHQVAYLQDLNFSPLVSATALGFMLGMSIIGRLACGFLGMKFEGRRLAVFFLTGMGLGIMALMLARGVFSFISIRYSRESASEA